MSQQLRITGGAEGRWIDYSQAHNPHLRDWNLSQKKETKHETRLHTDCTDEDLARLLLLYLFVRPDVYLMYIKGYVY